MRMDPTVKAQWLAALRDPDAKQGKGMLHRDDGSMCCLGVLCDLAVKAAAVHRPKPCHDQPDVYEYDGFCEMPPPSVLDWAGILHNIDGTRDQLPDIEHQRSAGYGNLTVLSDRNDSGASFAQIADRIERDW